MKERLENQLSQDGQIAIDRIMQQLNHRTEVRGILNYPFTPTMNTREYMRKPSGKHDQGFREDK